MKKNPSTPRNWEHLCHQRKNAVNNWTIIDRQPFEYEAVCNVAVEGKLQNGSVARLSNACASPFVPIMACCVLTLQESAGSTAGSLGLSASIILHIRHIMKKEQAERSLSIYFLQHPSLSAPLTSPWQTAQPAAVPLTADMQRGANILSPSQLTNFSDLLPQAMILSSFPAGKSHTDAPAGETRWATSQPPASPAEVTHGKPFITPVDGITTGWTALKRRHGAQEIWAALEALVHFHLQNPNWSVPRKKGLSWADIVPRNTYLSTSSTLLLGATSPAAQIALPRVVELQY